MSGISLIAGLGNPGPGYAQARHNAGYWFLDALQQRTVFSYRSETRFRAELADILVGGQKLRLLRPTTWMNESGGPVSAVARYFGIEPAQVLVVHDDLDLPPGIARLKRAGGHGGHNGLRSIFQELGSQDFPRLRLGIGHPGSPDDVTDYVLRTPSIDDRNAIGDVIERTLDLFNGIAMGDWEKVMNQLHSNPRETED
ncbi:MAG: aminoacyl-tRNA hydrolase [Pseudomonadota bacterium]|nr:aminoacyl-tRNA hydrolase [Pseudomonadota bacterium]